MRSIHMVILAMGFVGLTACGSEDDPSEFSARFSRSDAVDSIFATPSTEDLAPGFYLTLMSFGVSSAKVTLNDEALFRPSDFHNRDFSRTQKVELLDNNTLDAVVRGSPGDQLCVHVFEVEDDEEPVSRTLFEECVDRRAGPPNAARRDL